MAPLHESRPRGKELTRSYVYVPLLVIEDGPSQRRYVDCRFRFQTTMANPSTPNQTLGKPASLDTKSPDKTRTYSEIHRTLVRVVPSASLWVAAKMEWVEPHPPI
jgi:hypothetical protein